MYQGSMETYGKSSGLNRVMPATRSNSESFVARNEIPYSRMQETIIESFVRRAAACLSACAPRTIASSAGMKTKLRASTLSVVCQ